MDELTPRAAIDTLRIAVIGLGYVGLPLAVRFAEQRAVLGFDIDPQRIAELRAGRDNSGQISHAQLHDAEQLRLSSNSEELGCCNTFIITVPTPIDEHKSPDLRPLLQATRLVASHLQAGALVIFESTVYPGATEEECVPLLEELSGLSFNKDFFVGYSPERINPGDAEHSLTHVVKVTSGSTPETLAVVDQLYASIIDAGTHPVSSIRIAEAAKVIENTQRDLNIALINELAMIFKRLGLDTEEVLRAAETKWNFSSFRPGLVGGHCLGVDPYYLTYKAQELGYHPEVILAGRRINDSMGRWLAGDIVKEALRRGITVQGARALVLGLTFKENCSDLRNSKVVDMVRELTDCGVVVDVHDPLAQPAQAQELYGLTLQPEPQSHSYDIVIIAVAHRSFLEFSEARFRSWGKARHLLCDLKYVLRPGQSDFRL